MELNSKIYIAGHRGMVGSAIWRNLKAKGYKNLIGKTRKELDLLDQKAVSNFFGQEKPEYVFLAAAKVGGIVANNTYRAQFIYENLQIQNNIIHQAYNYGVKKLMFLGSTCIYPRECPQPMKEDYLLTSPLEYTNESYAIAKIAGIKMCESYNLQYGTNFISVMPTNLYGPNDNFNLETSHVLPALLRKIHLGKCLEDNNWDAIRKDLNNRPIEGINGEATEKEILTKLEKYGISLNRPTFLSSSRSVVPSCTRSVVSVEIWGSGKPMREFLWSEDMADACVYIMENVDFIELVKHSLGRDGNKDFIENGKTIDEIKQMNIEIRNTHINIGSGKEISIKEMAGLVKEVIGFKGELVFNTQKPDGTLRKLTYISKLNKLGWQSKIEIKDGIKYIYKWYRS